MSIDNPNTYVKPFLRWAGGKTQLLPEIEKRLPGKLHTGDIDTYVEPFIGGGAVMFWMMTKYPDLKQVVINDLNSELINTYQVIKYEPGKLIKALKELQGEYYRQKSMNDKKAFFLTKRDEFND